MTIKSNIYNILKLIGEDTERNGLIDTPSRVSKAWAEWTSGYLENPQDILKTFEDGAEYGEEILLVKDIPFYSHCEHHMAPFFGQVSVAYIPNGKIVGLSKFSRVVQIFSKRLQVQERLTNQIADAINDTLNPLAVGVYVTARHLCMESRGICQQGHTTQSIATRGEFKRDGRHRKEFLQMVQN